MFAMGHKNLVNYMQDRSLRLLRSLLASAIVFFGTFFCFAPLHFDIVLVACGFFSFVCWAMWNQFAIESIKFAKWNELLILPKCFIEIIESGFLSAVSVLKSLISGNLCASSAKIQYLKLNDNLSFGWKRVLLANSITFTPGTIVANLENETASIICFNEEFLVNEEMVNNICKIKI